MVEKLKLGVSYPLQVSRHLESDFKEIKDSGANSILLAVSEDSLGYNFEGIVKAVDCAKEVFDYVSFNFWAMGGIFGGEASSYFLQRYPQESQAFNILKGAEGAVCPQSKSFRDYFFSLIREVIGKTKVDEVFIDEPHWPTFRGDGRKIDDSVFSCSCDRCQKGFFEKSGFGIPVEKDGEGWDEFVAYRSKVMMDFLRDVVDVIKSCRNSIGKEVLVNLCAHSKDNWVYGSPKLEDVFDIEGVDVVSIDPYHFKYDCEKGKQYVLSQVQDILRMTDGNGKRVQVWVQGFRVPKGRESEIIKIVRMIYEEGVRDIQFWSYGNEAFSSIWCDDIEKVWENLRCVYLEVRRIDSR